MEVTNLCKTLYDIGAIKFGNFTLKSGIQSPIYIDLRCTISSSDMLSRLSDLLFKIMPEDRKNMIQCICGVPYTALPFATVISLRSGIGMVLRRKERKEYGSKQQVDGVYETGWTCLLVEDVITSGASLLETAKDVEAVGLRVTDALVIMDREQGGLQAVQAAGINVHCLLQISKVTDMLHKLGKLNKDTVDEVSQFIADNQFTTTLPQQVPKKKGFAERGAESSNAMTRKLLDIVVSKESNLVLSADVGTVEDLLKVCEECGPHVCAVKTHADVIPDFTQDTGRALTQLATRYNFLLIEDRKYADIGQIVSQQYRTVQPWAHMVTVHGIPGPDTIRAIKQVASEADDVRGCLIVAEMSSKGQLAHSQYSRACEELAECHSDFVVGFIAQNYHPRNANFIVMSPGVHVAAGGDGLGQQYRSPQECMSAGSTDIIIVGRGITGATGATLHPRGHTAELYRREAWRAYTHTLHPPAADNTDTTNGGTSPRQQ